MITSEVLLAIAPGCHRSAMKANVLELAAQAYEITTTKRTAAWLAQLAHESAGFNVTVENLNYKAEALLILFEKYFPDYPTAKRYERRPPMIGSRVYANRMGNGNEASGEGYKFRGRGFIQITGKDNYTRMAKALSLPLVNFPDQMEIDRVAALSAALFWKENGCNELADTDSFEDITRRINGGTTGYADRVAYWEKAKAVL